MTEIVARLPRARGPFRPLQALAAAAGLALVAVGIVALRPQAVHHVRAHPFAGARAMRGAAAQQTVADAAAAAALQARLARTAGALAAHGFDRELILASPGGVLATAARVARWKPLVVRAARGSGFSPNLLEGMVFVESSGRSAVSAGPRAGLTQLGAARARSLGLAPRARFLPLTELRATVRYLVRARRALGRADLAVASYHLGLGALARDRGRSFARVWFGSVGPAWRRLGTQGAAARDYYWKVLAAARLMHVWRHDPSALAYEARLQARKNSAEEVLHPRPVTPRFRTPNAIARAWRHRALRAIPRDASATHVAIGPFVGQEARKLGRSRRLYRGLRPQALDVLLYIGRRVHQLSGVRRPLIVTSAVRDDRYQRVLQHVNVNAARSYSLHTTGYAFDIARAYANGRQARAFQSVLDRLQALDAIAYIRETAAIHVAVSAHAASDLRLLRRLG